jgi:hypothetical protein
MLYLATIRNKKNTLLQNLKQNQNNTVKTRTKITVLSSALITLFSLASHISSAQFMSMPTKFSTPMGKITVNQPVHMPRYVNNYTTTNSKHLFTIVLLNDSTFEKKAYINIDAKVHELKWVTKKVQSVIVPSETKEIYRIDPNGMKISGKPMDSCWIFLVDTGKIRTYSVIAEMYDPLISYIQKDTSAEIMPLTANNLELLVADNEKALALVKKGKLLKAIRVYNKN